MAGFLCVTCDSKPSLYFHNKRNGTFEETGLVTGLAVNEDGREQAGMGATAADYDGDGYLDIFKTNFSSDTNTLYRNLGDGTFADVTSRVGLAVHTQYVKWGTAFLDFDNDGSMEIVVVNLFESLSLLKNFAPRGNSLLIRVVTATGRHAVGARVTFTAGGRKQIDEVRSGGYHISQGDFRVHFGLGHENKTDVSISWLQGGSAAFHDVEANQWIVVREGKGIVERRRFAGSLPAGQTPPHRN